MRQRLAELIRGENQSAPNCVRSAVYLAREEWLDACKY